MEEKIKVYQALMKTIEKVPYSIGNNFLDQKGMTLDISQDFYVLKAIYEKEATYLEFVYKNSKMKLLPKWETISYKQFVYEYCLYVNGTQLFTFTRDEGQNLHNAYDTNYVNRIKKQEDIKNAQKEKNFKEWLKNNS